MLISADVVLNTRKPQEKNVNGGDVTDSLYYIHVDVLPDLPSRRIKIKPTQADNKLPRKPVPGSTPPEASVGKEDV